MQMAPRSHEVAKLSTVVDPNSPIDLENLCNHTDGLRCKMSNTGQLSRVPYSKNQRAHNMSRPGDMGINFATGTTPTKHLGRRRLIGGFGAVVACLPPCQTLLFISSQPHTQNELLLFISFKRSTILLPTVELAT